MENMNYYSMNALQYRFLTPTIHFYLKFLENLSISMDLLDLFCNKKFILFEGKHLKML